jgi:hypothetical protein
MRVQKDDGSLVRSAAVRLEDVGRLIVDVDQLPEW